MGMETMGGNARTDHLMVSLALRTRRLGQKKWLRGRWLLVKKTKVELVARYVQHVGRKAIFYDITETGLLLLTKLYQKHIGFGGKRCML